MDEKILNDEEAELFGLKRKIRPDEDGAADAAGLPAEGAEVIEVPDMDAPEAALEEMEEVPLDELSARLDEGYTLDGYYVDEDAVPVDFSRVEEDDESLVMLSPEEAAAAVRRREEKAKKERELFEKLVGEGDAALEAKDFEKARECFTQANEIYSDDLALNVGYMRAYSEDFTALEEPDMLSEVYGQCRNSAGDAFSSRIRELFGERIAEAKAAARQEEEKLLAAHAKEQSERGKALAERAAAQNGLLLKWGLPFVVCALAAVLFVCFVNSIRGNLFVILAAVFGGIAVVLLVPTLFALRKAVGIARLQRENERFDSTEAGQELLLVRRRTEFLEDCLETRPAEEEENAEG